MCIRDRHSSSHHSAEPASTPATIVPGDAGAPAPARAPKMAMNDSMVAGLDSVRATAPAKVAARPVSYTHLRAHETVLDLVCRLLLEKKQTQQSHLERYA